MASALKTFKKDLPKNIVKYYNKCADLEQKKDFLRTFGYIIQMCQSLDINDLSIIDYTKLIKDDKFVKKNEINSYLFTFVEKVTPNPNDIISSELVFKLTDAQKKVIETFKGNNNEVQRARNDIAQCERNIADYNRQILVYLNSIKEANAKIERVENAKPLSIELEKQFDIISKMKEYSDCYFDEENATFYCLTNKEIYCADYNFGILCLRYNVKENLILVGPHLNNFNTSQIHPHVFSDGRVCYGTANASVYEWLADREISKIYSVIDLIFKNYNKDSPVTPISRYKNIHRYTNIQAFADSYGGYAIPKKNLHKKFWEEVLPNSKVLTPTSVVVAESIPESIPEITSIRFVNPGF